MTTTSESTVVGISEVAKGSDREVVTRLCTVVYLHKSFPLMHFSKQTATCYTRSSSVYRRLRNESSP